MGVADTVGVDSTNNSADSYSDSVYISFVECSLQQVLPVYKINFNKANNSFLKRTQNPITAKWLCTRASAAP